jgi:hypothetical protein
MVVVRWVLITIKRKRECLLTVDVVKVYSAMSMSLASPQIIALKIGSFVRI